MLCSISGTVPEEPVVSKKSGLIFERRLIEKVIQDTGRCPVTDDSLDTDDILPISTSTAIKPRTIPATSVPGLLSLFQNEWDSTVLETHQLRKALQSSRQELSHALYQHDAATRVIARLMRERDALRAELEAIQRSAPTQPAANGAKRPAAAPEEPAGKKAKGGLTSDVVDKMTACSAELSKGRKTRAISPTVATPEDIAGYSLLSNNPLHSTVKGGIIALDIAPGSDDIIASGGLDGSIKVYNRSDSKVVATLKADNKKINDVKFIGSGNLIASGSVDKTVRLWKGDGAGKYDCAAVLSDQDGEVVSLVVHPTNDYIISAATDGSWAMYDVAKAECLTRVTADNGVPLTACALHPDGLILGTANEQAVVRVWETRQQKSAAQFEGHTGRVNSMAFSENGYMMASAGEDGVKIWDLRKLKVLKALTPYSDGVAATSVRFDYSGLFLAVGGADARVYATKQDFNCLKEFTEVPKKGVNTVVFGSDARSVLVGGNDHKLRIFGGSSA